MTWISQRKAKICQKQSGKFLKVYFPNYCGHPVECIPVTAMVITIEYF